MGMSQEVVDNLLTNSEKVPKHGSGVGLINVHTRIQLMFGKEYGLKIYSEREIKEVEKSGEKVNIIDLTPQEIAALQESEFQMETKPTDEDLREELTTRLCTMDFSAEQMDEAKKALAIKMDLEYLLEYLKPETSIEEMKEKLEKYQSR